MKKIFSTLSLAVIILTAKAQKTSEKKMTEYQASSFAGIIYNAAKSLSSNTLTPSTLNQGGCATNTANVKYYSITQYTATPTYTIDAKGFAFGTNLKYLKQGATSYTLSNNRAAQKYSVVGTTTISSVIVLSAKHGSSAGTSMVNAKIYAEDPGKKSPAAAIGTAASKALNTFTGNDQLVFATPVVVTAGNFFVSIESPALGGATNDTLAILSTKQGCSSTDSLAWEYTQALGAGGFWSSVMSGVSADNLDLFIFPVADIGPSTLGINSISKSELTLMAAFPNPANNELSINFSLDQSSKIEIVLYDVTGKEMVLPNTAGNGNSTFKTEEFQAGKHSKVINVSGLNAGVYLYSIKSNNSQLMSKFTVIK